LPAGWAIARSFPALQQCGLRAQRARPGAAADRRLPGRRRLPPAGPRAEPRRGNRLGQAETLNCLGELSSRTARPATATPRRWPSPATSAPPRNKHAPWKASAAATSATATPSEPPPHYGMRSRSTSASAAPPPGASRKPCANMGSPQPQHTPPTARNLPINADDRHVARSRASNSGYRKI
jgi:hypothetical protein